MFRHHLDKAQRELEPQVSAKLSFSAIPASRQYARRLSSEGGGTRLEQVNGCTWFHHLSRNQTYEEFVGRAVRGYFFAGSRCALGGSWEDMTATRFHLEQLSPRISRC